MNCSDLEALLCDYIDGMIESGRKAEIEGHLATCPACAERARDAAAAVEFLKGAEKAAAPPELVTRILFDLSARHKRDAVLSEGWSAALGRLLAPILQPRFAMGMAMTVLSFSMIGRFAGVDVRQLKMSDLDPVRVWRTVDDRLNRGWERAVKFYESLRLIYDIRSRLNELAQVDDDREAAATASSAGPAAQPAQTSPGARNSPQRRP